MNVSRLARDAGPQTDAYSLTSDQENKWLTGGTEQDVIAEAHLDAKSIFNGVQRFAQERPRRLDRLRSTLASLD